MVLILLKYEYYVKKLMFLGDIFNVFNIYAFSSVMILLLPIIFYVLYVYQVLYFSKDNLKHYFCSY